MSSNHRGIRELARELRWLHTLSRSVESMPQGVPKVRASVRLLERYQSIDRLRRRCDGWCRASRLRLAAATTKAAAEPAQARLVMRWVDEAIRRGGDWRQQFDAVDAAIDGLGQWGRMAAAHRVAHAVVYTPEKAQAVAGTNRIGWRRELVRMATTGLLGHDRRAVYLGPLDPRGPDLFSVSVTMADTMAHLGATAGLEAALRCLRLPRRERRRLLAIATAVREKSPATRCHPRDRDEVLLALVGRFAHAMPEAAEAWTETIHGDVKRARGFAAVLQGFAHRLVVRRDLRRLVAEHLEPIELSLVDAELALAAGNVSRLWDQVLALRAPLTQLSHRMAPPSPHDRRPSPWERALRCAMALVLAGHALPPIFPARVRRAALLRPYLRREVASCLPPCPHRFDEMLAGLAPGWREIAPILRGLQVENQLRSCAIDENLRAAERRPEAWRTPRTADEALTAGAFARLGEVAITKDARDPLRAHYDLGLALSPRAGAKRTVLLRATRASLRANPPVATLGPRLACLRVLEGGSSAETVQRILRDGDLPLRPRMELLSMLASSRPREARRLLWSAFASLTDDGERAREVLALLRRAGAVGEEASRAWGRLRDVLGADAGRWWDAFARAWQARIGDIHSGTLAHCGVALRMVGVREPEAQMARVEHLLRHWRQRGLERAIDEASPEALGWILAAAEPFPERPWAPAQWRRFLKATQSEAVRRDEVAVRRFADKLRRPEMVGRWLRGRPPVPDVDGGISLGRGRQLVYLDKRSEVFAWLRLADAVPCCFNSDGGHFYGDMRTFRWVYRLWRDPLSFGLHVRQGRQQLGFVFGSYGESEGEPVLLLNGIYLRRQNPADRAAVATAIEVHLARPLGIGQVGIAVRHGGSGALPGRYQKAVRTVVRHRALRNRHGAPETHLYDDICTVANRPTRVELMWATVSDAPQRAAGARATTL